MAKASKAEIIRRISEVETLLLNGAEYTDIVQYSSEKKWEVGGRQVRKYIAIAERRMAETLNRDRDRLLVRHLRQRRLLFARCMKINDYKTALQVLRDEAELEQLYGPTKIAPTDPTGERPYDGTAGLAALIPELRAAMERHGSATGEPCNGDVAAIDALSGGSGSADGRGGLDPGLLAKDVAPFES